MVKKFHKYLYGWTFAVHTDNNLLTYMLTMVKLDAASHHWVVSLANYNFRLQYRAGKANIDADALLRVSWPGCMPDSSGTHIKVTTAAMQAVHKAALQGPASPTEAYSSDLHFLDILQDSKQIVLPALHGCTGERACWEMLPVSCFQSQAVKSPLKNIVATNHLELVYLDYLCLEPGKGLEENVLVVTNHFTRYAQTAQMTAKTLWDKFIVHYGLPQKILMDQG